MTENKIRKVVKQQYLKKGFNPKTLGLHVGLSQATLYKFFNEEKSIRLANLLKVIEALDIDLSLEINEV